MTAPGWNDLIDLDKLAFWMDGQGLGGGRIDDPKLLAGGTQNVLLRFTRADREFVLRRPPAHSIANGSETMRREARVLGALAATDVPHASLIANCPDEDILGAAFYLMEPVEGFNATVALPPLHASDPSIRRQMGFALIDAVTALGRVDPFEVGLEDFGKLDNFLTRQPSRWKRQLEGYARHEGWPGSGAIPGIAGVGAWLEENCPATFTPGIMHGDYHLANVMYRHDSPAVAAIVDWELATVGDPLIDLAWILATWTDPADGPGPTAVTPWEGFPDADELVERYRAGSRRDLSSLLWYKVLACYKLGILLEGTYARAAAGKADPEVGQILHDRAVILFGRAVRWIDAGK
jgi:aminoglycoside phosphotransferase (APT) family kinase protein